MIPKAVEDQAESWLKVLSRKVLDLTCVDRCLPMDPSETHHSRRCQQRHQGSETESLVRSGMVAANTRTQVSEGKVASGLSARMGS